VSRLAEPQYIVEEFGQLRIGALTTHNTVLRSIVPASCPIIIEAYQHVANHSIRNRGSIGGNLCHNDPAFELPLVMSLPRRDDGGAQRAFLAQHRVRSRSAEIGYLRSTASRRRRARPPKTAPR
jgi:FAD binding domain in molybdopterin dehydrogenase